jgi:hypothetical protein
MVMEGPICPRQRRSQRRHWLSWMQRQAVRYVASERLPRCSLFGSTRERRGRRLSYLRALGTAGPIWQRNVDLEDARDGRHHDSPGAAAR